MPCIAKTAVPNCPGPGSGTAPTRCVVCKSKSFLIARRDSLEFDAGGGLWGKPPVGTDLLKKWTGNVDRLLADIHKEFLSTHHVGPPCGYAFTICGSGARQEACPYSDLDCIMLVESDKPAEVNYFRTMCTFLDTRLQNLQEEAYKSNPAAPPVNGLRFCDGGLNPLGRRGKMLPPKTPTLFASNFVELIRTPHRMAEAQENPDDKHISDGLLETRFSFGSSEQLHTAYREEVASILGRRKPHFSWRPLLEKRKLMALGMLGEVLVKFPVPDPAAKKWELKTGFYRTPQFVAKSLAFWYGIDAVGTEDQVVQLLGQGRLSMYNARRIRRVLQAVATVRVLAHLEAGSEVDGVVTFGNQQQRQNPQEKLLTRAETDSLKGVIQDLRTLHDLTRQFLAEKTKAVGRRRNPFA